MSKPSSDHDADQRIDLIARALREQPVPDFPDPVIPWPSAGTMLATPGSTPRVTNLWSATSTLLMNRKSAFAATVVVFAVLAGVVSLPGSRESRAFAQVQSALKQVDVVVFRLQTFKGDEPVDSHEISFKNPDLIRADDENGFHIINGQTGQAIDVDHLRRQAAIRPVYDLASVQRRVMGAYARLLEIDPSSTNAVTDEVIDGQAVKKLRIVWDGADALLLVHAETHLPIRLEIDRGKDESGKTIRDILDGFQFNPQLDESIFAIQAPEGYDVETVKRQPPVGSDSSLALSQANGIGPVRFGMSGAEVVALLGQPDTVQTRPGVEVIVDGDIPNFTPEGNNVRVVPAVPAFTIDELIYDSRGFRIAVSSKDGVINIRAFGQHYKGPSSRRFLGKTPEGIEIGDGWRKVRKTYGDPVSERKDSSLYYTEPLYHFEFQDGKLISIYVTAPHNEEK